MSKLRSTLLIVWLAAISAVVGFVAVRDTPVAQGAPAAAAPGQASQKLTVDEINVHRINVIEPDGKPRVIIAARSHMPGTIFEGVVVPAPRTDIGGGLMFYNDEGTEAGGLSYRTGHDGNTRDNGAILTIDQYDQLEQVALTYQKVNGSRNAGLTVYADLPETSILPVIQAWGRVQAAKTPAEKQQAQAELVKLAPHGIGHEHIRAFVGKEDDTAKLVLGDRDGHPRIVLAVDGKGAPSIELRDATGKVVKRIAAP